MAKFRKSIADTATNAINDVFDKTSTFLGGVNRALFTDFPDLLEKAAEFKISQLGTPVLDHVTFFTDILGVNTTSGAYNKKALNTLQNKTNELKAKGEYVAKYYEQEIKRLDQVFKFKENTQNPNFYSVMLDNIYITITRPRNIVKTQVIGEDFTVKEFIGNGDYMIIFTGILSGSNQYQTDVKRLKQLDALFSLKKSIKVNSIFLNNYFNILNLVIEDYNFSQRTDYGNLTDFSITAVSDPENYNPVKNIII